MRIPDIAADPRSVGFPPNHPPMRRSWGRRSSGAGRVFGNIYLTEKQGAEEFDDEDERALVVLATQAASRSRTRASTRRRSGRSGAPTAGAVGRTRADREGAPRRRDPVAVRGGDGPAGLASMSPDPEIARRLEAAVEDIDHAIRDLRNYIFGLRPGILADRQLDQALQQLGEEFADRTGVVTVVDDQRAGGIRACVSRRGRRADRPRGPVQRRPPRGGDDLPRPLAARSRGAASSWRSTTTGRGSIRRCHQRGWVCPTFASAPPRSAERSRSRARRARAPRCGSRSRGKWVLTSRASPEAPWAPTLGPQAAAPGLTFVACPRSRQATQLEVRTMEITSPDQFGREAIPQPQLAEIPGIRSAAMPAKVPRRASPSR